MLTGIIGKPNTGKSTFFNAATLLNAPMANYPFTTISPNFGVGHVRAKCVHESLGVTDSPVNSYCIDGWRLIPVKLVDVAGLVPGASEGRGLGNKFLDDLRQADALIHVLDASGSTDEEGRLCPPGSHDPTLDVEFVEREFDTWLKQILSKDFGRLSRTAEAGAEKFSRIVAERLSGLSIGEEEVLRALNTTGLSTSKPSLWSDKDVGSFCTALRTISKPMLIAANKADLPSSKSNIDEMKKTGRLVVPCASEAELLLRRAAQKSLIKYLPGDPDFEIPDESKLSMSQRSALELVRERVLRAWGSSGVQQVINSAFIDLLGGVVAYPVEDENRLSDKKGNVLPDAYIMKRGATARDLAYAIHTDLGQTFLYAIDARRGTRLAADYLLREGDVIKIVAAARRV